ncbi:MAG: hypothetical protein JWO37_3457 [Acidimicrobiales bacterium]|nr:hypothetical protein [Acidimicrobiales bacterium]
MPLDAARAGDIPPATPEELVRHTATIEAWVARQRDDNPALAAVDRDQSRRRWYIRLRGEARDFVAIWLTLGEYTLGYETYLMPAPEERVAEVYELLLRATHGLYAMGFAIGGEDAVYLVGHLPLGALTEDELDRIVGSTYAAIERWFRPAMRLGFGSRFHG